MKADVHIHLLPRMDSGPAHPGVAAEMLRRLYNNRFRIFVAAPHFDPDREEISEFLLKRRLSIASLREAFGKDFRYVHLLPSAEVALVSGVSSLPELPCLAIPGTNLLPVLFPICDTVGVSAMREISVIIQKLHLCPLFCHTERAFPFFGDRFAELLGRANCAFVFSPYALTDNTLAIKLLQAIRRGAHLFLGSNAHDLEGRPPSLRPVDGYSKTAAYVHGVLRRKSDEFFSSLVTSGTR